MSDIEALRKSLSLPADGKSADEKRQMAVEAIVTVIKAVESGVGTFGQWEQRNLTLAMAALLANKFDDARSLARRSIWPEENRRSSAFGRYQRQEVLLSLPELKQRIDAAGLMSRRIPPAS